MLNLHFCREGEEKDRDMERHWQSLWQKKDEQNATFSYIWQVTVLLTTILTDMTISTNI